MPKYSVSFTILGYMFTIITNSEQLIFKQIHHITQFCYSKPCMNIPNNDGILINYIEDKAFFERYKTLINNSETQTIQTFEKEYHLKAQIGCDTYFMQLPDKYVVIKKSNEHFILVGDGVRDTTKYVFRMIREILVRLQENTGKLFMHATSLNVNNIGISILGNAGSGKTTYFSKLLSNGNSAIISNDRTFFHYTKENKVIMEYFPIPVVYKIGAVIHNSELYSGIIESHSYALPKTFIDGVTSFPVPLTDVPKFFFNTKSIESSNLDLIIMSKIDFDNPFCFEATHLSASEARSLILNTCFTPTDTESLRSVWIYPREKNDYQLKEESFRTVENIINSTSVFHVRFGKDIAPSNLLFNTMHLLE